MATGFPHLLSPVRIGNVEVRNRLVTSAHGSALPTERRPNRRLAVFHAARAKGGVGLIILENSRVHPTGRGGPIALEAWHEENIPHFRMVAEAVHQRGAKIFAQLHPSGAQRQQPRHAASRVGTIRHGDSVRKSVGIE